MNKSTTLNPILNVEVRQRRAKCFYIRNKLILILGLLILAAGAVQWLGLLAVNIAYKAVTEKAETNLTDTA